MNLVSSVMTAIGSPFSGNLQAHRALRWRFRSLRARLTGLKFRKLDRPFNSKAEIITIGNTDRVSGLARSYRYEMKRLETPGGAGQTRSSDKTVIILGQPRGYRRLLATAPKGFRTSYRIGLWVTEFDCIPPDWRFALDIVHEIWTPSTFCAKAIRAETDIPVKVVPHSVSIPDVAPMNRRQFGIKPDQFLALAIMDLRNCPDRKNPVAHVRAWKMAFAADPTAHLLMKVRFSHRTQFMKQELLKELDGAENISLTELVLTDLEMTAFQKMGDVFLSLHRSEGYGLNIKEMLEIGVPTIATGWSGNMDFMPLYANAISIRFELVPYADRTFHYEGSNLRWAEADVAHAAAALRDIKRQWQDARRTMPSMLAS